MTPATGLGLAVVLALAAVGHAEAAAVDSAAAHTCPITAFKRGFDLNRFLGDWYVLEYEYLKDLRLDDFSCVGLHFSLTSLGDLQTNLTFRFPAKTGFFYHVPTFSTVGDLEASLWETQLRGGQLLSVVVDTDYDSWAVVAQCRQTASSAEPTFLSTRVLARRRRIDSAGRWLQVQAAVESVRGQVLSAGAQHKPLKFAVDQDVCQELDARA